MNERGPLPDWWPRCTVCSRPIERMAWTFDPAQADRVGFRANCHGATAAVMTTRARAMTGELLVMVGRA